MDFRPARRQYSIKQIGNNVMVNEASAPSVAGWNELIDALRDLPARMLAKLPEASRSDPQIQQEIGRLALSALASQTIDALAVDGDHPSFTPSINNYLTIGQPNADTSYRGAQFAAGGVYRLRGRKGTLKMVRIAQSGPAKAAASGEPVLGPQRIDHDLNALQTDAEGYYDVILSVERPAGYTGDWWPLLPTSNRLLVRLVSSDWEHEISPTLSIERLDKPAPRPRPSAAELEAKLRALPHAIGFIAPMFVGHVEQLRQDGYINKLKIFDVSQMGGLASQFYYEGAYDLQADEALIVESTVPEVCLYRSLILTNDIYETTDWYNNHSSLNDAQAPADADGILRIVVSAKDPGVPNWLDTAGYPTGAIQGRWAEYSSTPVPSVKKVPLNEIRTHLPPETPVITPEQREQLIRDRRAALQQRPLW
jgi:hypothetical protein